MFGALLGPALLLLASSAEAQQTTEGVLTVQTSIPPLNTPCVGDECLISSTSICLENCIVEPCFPCSAEPTTSEIQMSIPEGETPIFTSELPTTSPEIITMTSVSTPTNETVTPITTSGQTSRPSSSGSGAQSSSTRGSSTSSGTAPAEQSTGAAAPGLKGDGTSYVFAMALSSMSMMFGAAWILL